MFFFTIRSDIFSLIPKESQNTALPSPVYEVCVTFKSIGLFVLKLSKNQKLLLSIMTKTMNFSQRINMESFGCHIVHQYWEFNWELGFILNGQAENKEPIVSTLHCMCHLCASRNIAWTHSIAGFHRDYTQTT